MVGGRTHKVASCTYTVNHTRVNVPVNCGFIKSENQTVIPKHPITLESSVEPLELHSGTPPHDRLITVRKMKMTRPKTRRRLREASPTT